MELLKTENPDPDARGRNPFGGQAGVSAKVMIGGAPVTQGYADKIGAHGYAADAASAVDLAKALVA